MCHMQADVGGKQERPGGNLRTPDPRRPETHSVPTSVLPGALEGLAATAPAVPELSQLLFPEFSRWNGQAGCGLFPETFLIWDKPLSRQVQDFRH